VLKKRCAIGANATVLAGVVIGTGALVGAGSVVTRSVPDNYIVVGIPARIIGRVKVREKRRKAIERAKKMLEFGIEPARKNAKSRH
jgi:acetyltransferase-like isoleucine patch superfamily enzyme